MMLFKENKDFKIIVDRSIADGGGSSITVDFLLNDRPNVIGKINENGYIHTGFVDFPDDTKYDFWYHPDEGIIYWGADNGDHSWQAGGVPIDDAFKENKVYKIIVDRSIADDGGWSITVDFLLNDRPNAIGKINENGYIHTGFVDFLDDTKYDFWYHPVEGIIYWGADNGDHSWQAGDVPIDDAFKENKDFKIIVDRSIAAGGGSSITVDFLLNGRPNAIGKINENGYIHTGFVDFPDDTKYDFWYHPDEGIIYWGADNGDHSWQAGGVPI